MADMAAMEAETSTEISGAYVERQQWRFWKSHADVISVAYVDRSHNRRAKPTEADQAAAERLRQIWDAIPRDRRPTQDQAADALDVTQAAVSQYRNGLIPLNARAVLLFAQLLRCRPEEIRDDLPELAAARTLTTDVSESPVVHDADGQKPSEAEVNRAWRELPLELRISIIEALRLARQPPASSAMQPLKSDIPGARERRQKRRRGVMGTRVRRDGG